MTGPVDVAVIGSGFAGLAAADQLAAGGVPVTVYEARPYWGGHTHSLERDGFTFDEGPHVSFTKDDKVRELFLRGAGAVEEFSARITNRFRDRWITHPAQVHLHGLDTDLVTSCIVDFVEAQGTEDEIKTYADWCRKMFGRTFAEQFPFAYTRKYWTVDAAEMSTDWVASRMYPPKLEEVVRGALAPAQEGAFHYLTGFRYPKEGGYQSFMGALVHEHLMRLNHRVVGVNPAERSLTFADGNQAGFSHLISTVPLPELISLIPAGQAPAEVRAAAEVLLCTSLVLVDVAVDRPDLFDHQWFYVYDEDMVISRGHFPHMLAAANAPEGCGSVQLEVYHSRFRPLPMAAESLAERVVAELVGMGILASPNEVRWAKERHVPYANVVFDHQRSAALATILPWVADQGIFLAGRYGEWGYHWTDDAVRSGWSAATGVLESLA